MSATVVLTVSFSNSISFIASVLIGADGNVVIVSVSTIVCAQFSVYAEVGSFILKAAGGSTNRDIIVYTLIASTVLFVVLSAAPPVYYHRTRPNEATTEDEDPRDIMASIHTETLHKHDRGGDNNAKDDDASTVAQTNPLFNKDLSADFGYAFLSDLEEDTKAIVVL
jgi:hypothetical protein